MVEDAESQASTKQQAISRQAASKGMLGSSNFFIASQSSLEQIFADEMKRMGEYALTVISPSAASNFVKRSGYDLESKFISRFDNLLSGKVSGNGYPGGGAKLATKFSQALRRTLIQVTSDTSNNFGRGYAQARGFNAFLHRNGWKIVTACLTVAGLVLTWWKLTKAQ